MVTEQKNRLCATANLGTYIRQENQLHQRLQSLGLTPGISFFLTGIQATKQKGFAKFNLAGYYKRKYREVVEPAGWFLLTNLDSLADAIKTFKLRSGIERSRRRSASGRYLRIARLEAIILNLLMLMDNA